MWQEVKITIRSFERGDIPNKVRWINDPANNRFLHYELPLRTDKTEAWFESHRNDASRYDAVIEADAVPVGVIGLLSIDQTNRKAEYYVTLGEAAYQGKGIAKEASRQLLRYAFETLRLNRVYLYTETKNEAAVRLFEALGFRREGLLHEDVLSHGRLADRFVYAIRREEWLNG